MNCILHIHISKSFEIECFLEDKEENITIISINNQNQFSLISIEFDMNEIIINQQSENTIEFMKEWIENPEDYKYYSINYQNKEYNIISEVLFALYMNQYKKKIEKEYIIEKTIVEAPTNNDLFINRLNVALDAIDLKGCDFENIEFDYQSQGEILHEIIDKN